MKNIFVFLLGFLFLYSCNTTPVENGNSSSSSSINNFGTSSFLNIHWMQLSLTLTNGTVSNMVFTNGSIVTYCSEFRSNSGLYLSRTYTNNSIFLEISNNLQTIYDDTINQCIVMGPIGDLKNGVTYIGYNYLYYVINSNFCTITNNVYFGTNISNPNQTTNIYTIGGNSPYSNEIYMKLDSMIVDTNISTPIITNWYLNAYWYGSGNTNTNTTYLDHYLHVYNFNTNNTYDYWGLTNMNFSYSHTNYSYIITNDNQIPFFHAFGIGNFGFITTNSTGISWDSPINSSNKTYGNSWYILNIYYVTIKNSDQMLITNIYNITSNYTQTNVIINNITNEPIINFTGTSNYSDPVYYDFRPTTNLNLPK